jgi:hypothetical protein
LAVQVDADVNDPAPPMPEIKLPILKYERAMVKLADADPAALVAVIV